MECDKCGSYISPAHAHVMRGELRVCLVCDLMDQVDAKDKRIAELETWIRAGAKCAGTRCDRCPRYFTDGTTGHCTTSDEILATADVHPPTMRRREMTCRMCGRIIDESKPYTLLGYRPFHSECANSYLDLVEEVETAHYRAIIQSVTSHFTEESKRRATLKQCAADVPSTCDEGGKK